MAAILSTGARNILKPIVLIQLAADLPANYQVTTLNTYISNASNDTQRIKVLSGSDSYNPSPVTSELTTEGEAVTQAIDISGTPTIVGKTAAEYNSLRTAFHKKSVRIIKCYVASLEAALNETTDVVTLSEGDEIEISHKLEFSFFLNAVSGQEWQTNSNFAEQLDANADTVAAYQAVVADP